MFCKNCGAQIPDNTMFCPNCGAAQTPAQTPNSGAAPGQTPNAGAYYQNQQTPPYTQQTPPYGQQGTPYGQQGAPYGQQGAPYGQQNYAYSGASSGTASVSFGEAVKLFFSNYTNFTGRSTRSEYWWVMLFNIIVSFALLIFSAVPVLYTVLTAIYSLATFVPGLSLFVRRLHDIGKSWPWLFMGFIPLAGPIILLVYMCTASGPNNEWGPSSNPNANFYR